MAADIDEFPRRRCRSEVATFRYPLVGGTDTSRCNEKPNSNPEAPLSKAHGNSLRLGGRLISVLVSTEAYWLDTADLKPALVLRSGCVG
jgi:hypothetical protein